MSAGNTWKLHTSGGLRSLSASFEAALPRPLWCRTVHRLLFGRKSPRRVIGAALCLRCIGCLYAPQMPTRSRGPILSDATTLRRANLALDALAKRLLVWHFFRCRCPLLLPLVPPCARRLTKPSGISPGPFRIPMDGRQSSLRAVDFWKHRRPIALRCKACFFASGSFLAAFQAQHLEKARHIAHLVWAQSGPVLRSSDTRCMSTIKTTPVGTRGRCWCDCRLWGPATRDHRV